MAKRPTPEDASAPAVPPDAAGWTGDDPEDGGGYRRRPRPVRVRQRHMAALAARTGRTLRRLWPLWVLLVVVWFGYHVATTSTAFVLASSQDIGIVGAPQVPRAQVRACFAADLGRNIYFIPLPQRERALERLPWVRRAAVLRIWPNRLQVRLQQRSPVAFARRGGSLMLIDADGVLLPLPPRADYQFPVLTGLALGRDQRAQRQQQVAQYLAVEQALQPVSAGAAISEVNVADGENTVLVLAPPGDSSVRLDLGNQDYLARYRLFAAHIGAWREEYPSLRSVNLRYPGQAILDSATAAAPRARVQRQRH